MKKKIAIVLTSLLILTVLLTTPHFTPTATADPAPRHWKVVLAQKGCNAMIVGNLTRDREYIPGTDFALKCICELPPPQPLSQFVFWKVALEIVPNDIDYVKYIDWNKDGIWEIIEPISGIFLTQPTPEEPHVYYEHVEEGMGPFGPWMVVVEVHETEISHEWQLTLKQEKCNALWTGFLTLNGGKILGTDFNILCNGTQMQCQVVRTPNCTIPNDITSNLLIDWDRDGDWDVNIPLTQIITQFPWTWIEQGPTWKVELELTEVQMHRYILMSGEMDSSGDLSDKALWSIGDWKYGAGTPFATRAPNLVPLLMGNNITFTQKDPITGIVKLGVPAKSYVGLQHVWYGNDSRLWYNMTITMNEQGCGYLFTGEGKDPVLGDVDLITFNNWTGVYSLKPGWAPTLLAGPVTIPAGPGSPYPAYGAGPPLGPCLQELGGPDGIPGTADDPVGNGIADDPRGSAILYLPTYMTTKYYSEGGWLTLFSSPWPQLTTTGNATDVVIQPLCDINGQRVSVKGQPWEFLAGLDTHGYPTPTPPQPWKTDKCNAYFTSVCAWSVLQVNTALGWLQILFYIKQKAVRQDCIIADINCDEICDIFDITMIGLAYKGKDEGWGRPVASPNYDARADLKDLRGEIDIYDLSRCGLDYKKKLTPTCIVV